MAATLALAFQSSHLKDGLVEFLTLLRGCNLIAGESMGDEDGGTSAFQVGVVLPLIDSTKTQSNSNLSDANRVTEREQTQQRVSSMNLQLTFTARPSTKTPTSIASVHA